MSSRQLVRRSAARRVSARASQRATDAVVAAALRWQRMRGEDMPQGLMPSEASLWQACEQYRRRRKSQRRRTA